MTPFDKLAWWCSWVAPASLAAAGAAIVLEVIAKESGSASEWRSFLGPIALCAGAVGVLAHVIVHYHAVKPGSFTGPDQRSKLEVAVHFGAYGRWRDAMRAKHPELSSQSSGRINP